MNPGDTVRFRAHGETGLLHKVITREGDDCSVQDERGRVLRNVPVELLEAVPVEEQNTVRINPAERAWREVDELEAY